MKLLKVMTSLCLLTALVIIFWMKLENNNAAHARQNEDSNRHDHHQSVSKNWQQTQQTSHLGLQTPKKHQQRRGDFFHSYTRMNVTVYTKQSLNGSWTLDQPICCSVPVFRSAKLRTKAGPVDIYIHDPRKDTWVSAALTRVETWEQNTTELISKILQAEADAALLDIGANIGVYTLTAAKLGFKVIAVEPLKINVQRICSSIHAGNFTKNVTIVRGALSNILQKVNLGIVVNNVGGSFVLQGKNAKKAKSTLVTGKYQDIVWTSRLDDILQLPGIDFKKIIIKMDVEGYENKVLNGGQCFFDRVKVPAVLMEWNYHKNSLSGKDILDFFKKRNYTAYDPMKTMKLDVTYSNQWPADIIWIKNCKTFMRDVRDPVSV
ncbi:uncharacterized protein LOC132550149 [Ylistrum balloti]|uniref:uncharacterized protein LOC132550149 n=1 Tax=Ylistrum balloti TaxID=509963 RepID=UPI002905C825|nr:uncharacterized protein LOC132550149 [Ylistrum balloti]